MWVKTKCYLMMKWVWWFGSQQLESDQGCRYSYSRLTVSANKVSGDLIASHWRMWGSWAPSRRAGTGCIPKQIYWEGLQWAGWVQGSVSGVGQPGCLVLAASGGKCWYWLQTCGCMWYVCVVCKQTSSWTSQRAEGQGLETWRSPSQFNRCNCWHGDL